MCSTLNADCKTSSHFALGADVSRQEVLKTRGISISRRLRAKLKLLLKLLGGALTPIYDPLRQQKYVSTHFIILSFVSFTRLIQCKLSNKFIQVK